MKTIIHCLAIFLALSVVAVNTGCEFPAKDKEGDSLSAASVSDLIVTPQISDTWDTLYTTASLDTVTIDLGTYYRPVDYEFMFQWDSINGGTNGSFYIEWSPELTGTFWVAHSTATTINGPGTGKAKITGEIVRGRLRGVAYAPSSTQRTRVRCSGNTVSRTPN